MAKCPLYSIFVCLLYHNYTCSLIVIYEMITFILCFFSFIRISFLHTFIQRVVKKCRFCVPVLPIISIKPSLPFFFSSILPFHFRFHSIWFWNVSMHNHKHIHTAPYAHNFYMTPFVVETSTWNSIPERERGIRYVTYVKLATTIEQYKIHTHLIIQGKKTSVESESEARKKNPTNEWMNVNEGEWKEQKITTQYNELYSTMVRF